MKDIREIQFKWLNDLSYGQYAILRIASLFAGTIIALSLIALAVKYNLL